VKLKAALKYQQMGFSIIPVKPDKKPCLMTWAEYQKIKPTEDTIKKWWTTWPDANPAIVTREISNIMVVDVDSAQGLDELNKLIPETLTTPIAKTPGGGWHYYFAYQNGLPNKARVFSDCDIRTDGGYIIAPPSIGENGKPYAWLDGLSIAEANPAAMPERLYNNMQKSTKGERNIKQGQHTATYRNIRNISFDEPGRDETLFHLANHLVKSGMGETSVQNYLYFFGQNCNPPFPEKEIQAKIESALKRSKNRSQGLIAEVREYITATWGNITATNVLQSATNATFEDRKKVRVILGRLYAFV